MDVNIGFKLSNKAREQELIATGKRGNTSRAISTDFADLTQDERAIVVKCGRDLGGRFDLDLRRVELLDKPRGYSPHDKAEVWLTEAMIELDAIPTPSEAVALADQLHKDNLPFIAEAKGRAQAAAQEARELRGRELAAYHKLHTQLYHPQTGLITTGNLDALRGFRFDGLEDRSFEPHTPELVGLSWCDGPKRKLSSQVSDAITDLEKKVYEAEKDHWIKEQGSGRLRRAWEAGHDCQRGYVTERAAAELPGWTVDFDNGLESKDRSYPTTDALNGLDKALPLAEKYGLRVAIEWIVSLSDNGEDKEYWEFDEREGLVMRDYLPRHSGRGGYTLYKLV